MPHCPLVLRHRLTALMLAGLTLPSPGPAQTLGKTQYVQASALNVRSAPQVGAPVLVALRLNEPVEAQPPSAGSPWCAVSARQGSVRGWADCGLLGAATVTLERLGQEIASATLALHRQMAPDAGDRVGLLDPDVRFQDPAVARAHIERLFGLLERHFTLSPSLHTLADYDSLLNWLMSQDPPGSPESNLRGLATARLATLARLRSQLTQLNTSEDWPSVRHPSLATLGLVLNQRRPGASTGGETRWNAALASSPPSDGPAPKPSLFRDEAWVIGWAGGPLVSRLAGQEPTGTGYRIRFNGQGYRALADLHEMLKRQHLPAQLRFESIAQLGEPSQASLLDERSTEGLIIQTRLPVWAITPDGLVAGTLRRASIGSEACTAEEPHRFAAQLDVVFERPVRGEIHGLFATQPRILPEKAVVTVRQRGSLAPPTGDDTLWTRRVDTQVDLDGDGVPDLRAVVSRDTAVGQGSTGVTGGLRPEVDRHAHELALLQGNQDGWWHWLSRAQSTSCR